MTTEQKLRDALQRIQYKAKSLADAQVIALEALALPTADHLPDAGEMVVDHLPNAGNMTNGLTQSETDASASVSGLTGAPVDEREAFDIDAARQFLASFANWHPDPLNHDRHYRALAIALDYLSDLIGPQALALPTTEPDVLARIAAEFPLFEDAGLDENLYPAEWALLQDRKRLHAIINGDKPTTQAQEFPAGAIENGREYARRLVEVYDFRDNLLHPLSGAQEWDNLLRCFEHLAEYAHATQPHSQELPDGGLLRQFLDEAKQAGITHLPGAVALAQELPDERAAFEKWATSASKTFILDRCARGYDDWMTDWAWKAWQARAALSAQAVPDGYALIAVNVLKAWGKLEEVQAACVYPIAAWAAPDERDKVDAERWRFIRKAADDARCGDTWHSIYQAWDGDDGESLNYAIDEAIAASAAAKGGE